MPDQGQSDISAGFEPDPVAADERFAVEWSSRLRFTRGVFDAANTVLCDVLPQDGAGPVVAMVFVDEGVARNWPGLSDNLRDYADVHDDRIDLTGGPITIPGGEPVKNGHDVFDRIVQRIHDAGLCRKSFVLAIGGGAALDAVGFAASIAHRGVRVIRIPTTTLSQDDSGVGVKNGVNAFGKKNYLGTFSPPWAVINDSDFLSTLSNRDWRCGFSEAVKVALVKDGNFFRDIARSADAIAQREMSVAEPVIRRSALLHLQHIVREGDPFELNEARPLDFGHWSAHKLEQMTNFELRHGEAVAIGIALDSVYSNLQGWLDDASLMAIIECLGRLGFDLDHPTLADTNTLFDGINEFREHLGGRLTLAMIRSPGVAHDVHEIDRAAMRESISRLREFARSGAIAESNDAGLHLTEEQPRETTTPDMPDVTRRSA